MPAHGNRNPLATKRRISMLSRAHPAHPTMPVTTVLQSCTVKGSLDDYIHESCCYCYFDSTFRVVCGSEGRFLSDNFKRSWRQIHENVWATCGLLTASFLLPMVADWGN